jgi:4-hydroxyphenylpyruvate dioxygenase-like putative hemolysin
MFKLPGTITEQTMNGEHIDYQLRNAVARFGSVEFELIQPVENAVLQEDFLESRGEGINHIGFKVDDFDKVSDKLREKGFDAILYRHRSTGNKAAYFDTNKVGGVIVEIFQPATE